MAETPEPVGGWQRLVFLGPPMLAILVAALYGMLVNADLRSAVGVVFGLWFLGCAALFPYKRRQRWLMAGLGLFMVLSNGLALA